MTKFCALVSAALGASRGAEPAGGTPEGYAAAIRADTATWARVVKEAGLRVE